MSTSMGTGLPGVGLTCAGIMEGCGADEGREWSKLGIGWTDWKASLEALFSSTFLVSLYHAVSAVSEGCPFAIVATAFCICGSKPL